MKVGVRGEDYVEILEGLRDDERVALTPNPKWKDGEEVEIDKQKTREKAKTP